MQRGAAVPMVRWKGRSGVRPVSATAKVPFGPSFSRQLRVLCAFGTARRGGEVGLSKPCWLSAYSVNAMSTVEAGQPFMH